MKLKLGVNKKLQCMARHHRYYFLCIRLYFEYIYKWVYIYFIYLQEAKVTLHMLFCPEIPKSIQLFVSFFL